jgi:hypothetical protein
MKNIVLLFVMLFYAVSTYADNLTVKGKDYQDYEITGYSDDGIIISHTAGTATVSLDDWPKDRGNEIAKYKSKIEKLREQQIEKASKPKAEKSAAVKAESRIPANAVCLIFKVISVGKGAVLGSVNAVEWSKKDNIPTQEKTKKVFEFSQYGKITKEIDKEYSGSNKDAKDYITLGKFAKEIDDSFNIVYVTGIDTSEYTDDQQVIIAGIRSGTHKYIAVNGAARTVPKFTAVKQ